MVFRGNIVTDITGNTFSDQGMLFGTFLIKIFSSIFQIIFWTIFLYDFIKKFNDFHRLCLHYHAVFVHNHQVWLKKHENFNEIEQNTWFKIGVGKSMKIFFMTNAPNNIPWPPKVSPVMFETIFPRKTMNFSCFFMFSDYCRVSYSKCMHCGIALQKRAFLVRARSQK